MKNGITFKTLLNGFIIIFTIVILPIKDAIDDIAVKNTICCTLNPLAIVKNNVSIELERWDGKPISELSNTFFAQYNFTFEIPDCPQVTQWRTVKLESDLVSLN